MNNYIIAHQQNLNTFTDIATRYAFDAIFNTCKPQLPYSVVTSQVSKAREFFELFRVELPKEIDNPSNGRAFEIDIKDRFLRTIKYYTEWYQINQEATRRFEPHNFYLWMNDIMLDTKREIEKYYPPPKEAEILASSKNISVAIDNTEHANFGSQSNFNGQIFSSQFSENLFLKMKEELVRSHYALADYSFLYWKLLENGDLKSITPTVYLKFINESHYPEGLDKIKTLTKCETDTKKRLFATVLAQFKSKKTTDPKKEQ